MDLFWTMFWAVFWIGAALLAVTTEALIAWWFDDPPEVQHDGAREGEPRSELELTSPTSEAGTPADAAPAERRW